ncbi:MAG: zf-HC2 domain-containing protein [Cellvibrionales bacterium]|nr:zf-HC2 domain-containing protein [Cellvibrionales bacterium]
MLKCKELTEKYANDYIDQELPLSKKMAIQFHLLMCKHCKQFVKQLTLAKQIITQRTNQQANPLQTDEVKVKSTAERLQKALNKQSK